MARRDILRVRKPSLRYRSLTPRNLVPLSLYCAPVRGQNGLEGRRVVASTAREEREYGPSRKSVEGTMWMILEGRRS